MGRLGLHLTQSDYSGLWHFVGSVPSVLAYVSKTGETVTSEYITSQLRLPASYRDIKTRTWDDYGDALELAESLGFDVDMITKRVEG